MSNDQMTKINTFNSQCFGYLNIFIFVIVSYFGFRISNFGSKDRVFFKQLPSLMDLVLFKMLKFILKQ